MHLEQRKADKSGCISFAGKKYEVGIVFAGRTVNVVYDPLDTETLTIEHKQTGTSLKVKELKIGPHTGPRPMMPKSMTMAFPLTSRLLDEKGKLYQKGQERIHRAIRFSGLDGGQEDV